MANEITVNISVSVNNGNLVETKSLSFQKDQTNARGPNPGVVTVGFAAEEDISFGDLTDPRMILVQNLDSTNFVEFGAKDTTMKKMVRLNAGEGCVFPLPTGVTIRAQADTANCDVLFWALDA